MNWNADKLGRSSTAPRVLCIEDNADQLQALCLLLKSQGFEVDAAASLSSAHDLLALQDYAVVVTDYWLPDGNLGQLLRQDARLDPRRTVVVSGSIDLHGIPPEIPIFVKPVDVGRLLERIREVAGRRHPR